MGALPPIKDFDPAVFQKLPADFLSSLSQTVRILVQCLTKSINFANISGANFPRQLLQQGRTISPTDPLKLLWPSDQKSQPTSVFCGGIWRRGYDSTDSIGQVISIEWDFDSVNSQLIVKRINGLTQPLAVDYQITITAFGG